MADVTTREGRAEWTSYTDRRPTTEGVYRWRVPSVAVRGAVLTFLAHMRERGAGFRQVLSPVFDHWDGYNVTIPPGVQWQEAPNAPVTKWHEITSIEIEGVDPAPCIYCRKRPRWDACERASGGGVVVGGDPHRLNSWRLVCCDWGSTPRGSDPRALNEYRNRALSPSGDTPAGEGVDRA